MRTIRTLFRFRVLRDLALGGVTLSACVALVVACGDDETPRPPFDDQDSGGQPNIPETGAPYDAGPRPDVKDPYSPENEEIVCAGEAGTCVKELAAGHDHFCALMADGTVHCWGKDEFGNLGRGSGKPDEDASAAWKIPPVANVTGATQISAGGETTCVRLGDGTLRCWGSNQKAELALTAESPPTNDQDPHPDPTPPKGVPGATRVDVGRGGSVCAVLDDGRLWCWGYANVGQLARPIPTDSVYGSPRVAEVEPLKIRSAQSGTGTMLGISSDGELWAWGALSGEEGYCSGLVASVSPSTKPRKVRELSKVTSLAITEHFEPQVWPEEPPPQAHACAIANGSLYCWGRSDKTALCTGKPDREVTPAYAPVESRAWPQRVSVAREITCARMTDGTIHCCGSNEHGRLTLPVQTTHSALLTLATGFKGHAVQVATSDAAVCALVQGGTVECWGGNLYGELGTPEPDEDDHPEPKLVSF